MHAIDTPDKQFKDGNGTSELGTILPAWWLNQVQAELLAVLTAAGIQPNKAKTNQIADAIKQIFRAGVVNNLTSDDADKPLSAAQGKKLQDAKLPYITENYYNNISGFNPGRNGFIRTNGERLNDQQLPPMEIHIAHPSSSNGAYSRGIGFSYGNAGWGLTTTAWDEQGNYRGQKQILTEENGVMLTGDQTINGGKTFGEILTAGRNNHWGFLRNPVESGGHWVFETNPKSNYADGSTLKVNIKYEQTNGQARYIHFPELGNINRTVAYQDWVTTQMNAATGAFDNKIEQAAPSGTVAYFAGRNAPAGWLKANGAAVSRTTYAALFAAIGTTYGAGDGHTTFNLPDFRGEFLRGWDDGRNIDRGRALGSAQNQSMSDHYHGIGIMNTTDDILIVNKNWSGGGNEYPVMEMAGEYNKVLKGRISSTRLIDGGTLTDGGRAYASGNGSAFHSGRVHHIATAIQDSSGNSSETRPRNVALLACIKI